MDQFPGWAEKFYDLYFGPYLPNTEAAQARVEQGLPRLLKHLPKKGSRVLDLCCGAGVYLFDVEKAGFAMTGVDIQAKMIGAAQRRAAKIGSRARIAVGDAMDLKFGDASFDAVLFLGAATGHFSVQHLRRVMSEAYRVLKPGGVLVAEINDHVALFLSGMYQRILYEPSGEKDVFSLHTNYDGEKGTFNRLFVDLDKNRRFKGSFQIWAPWIFNHIMDEVGFEFKASEAGAFGNFSRFLIHRKLSKRTRK
ncbi:MAG: class I SAM-dependent methyltransferase [Thaumarchaeota archaeon]|nr:class I SAM-dependent methyltransferase [Nitrososphaerota archaeon]